MTVKQVPGKGEKSTTKKPKKKFVGLAAKAKRRKQVSESRLAQRTGKSAKDRKIANLFKELKKNWKDYEPKKRPKIDWKKLLPKISPGNLLKKGGKAKKMRTYSKGGKAK